MKLVRNSTQGRGEDYWSGYDKPFEFLELVKHFLNGGIEKPINEILTLLVIFYYDKIVFKF